MLSWDEGILAFARFSGEDQVVVILNNLNELTEVTVPVWKAEVPDKTRLYREIYTYDGGYTKAYEEYIVYDGEVVVNMGAHSALVMSSRKPERPKKSGK